MTLGDQDSESRASHAPAWPADGRPSPPPAPRSRLLGPQRLMIALVAAVVAVAVLIAVLVSGSGTPSKDAAAARKILQNYLHLAATGDVTGACKLVTDASYQNAQRGPYGSCERFLIEKLAGCADSCQLNNVTIVTMDVRGTYATATWGVDPTATNSTVLEWNSQEGWRIDVN